MSAPKRKRPAATGRDPRQTQHPQIVPSTPANRNRLAKAISSRSTARDAQLKKLAALLALRPHFTYELRKMGISRPAGRVYDLQKLGFVIDRHRISSIDGDGFAHHGVSLYSLVSAPEVTL